ncbi:MAG TPA: peptide chain release factor N(5)-glutamine methyltransferase [Bacteroidales bacterium]|nr:peptide chain release factor N(5)-glutamine methyltransferase [Bacteroidales bacterium]
MITVINYISELSKKLQDLYFAKEAKSIAEYYVCETLQLNFTELIFKGNVILGPDDIEKLKSKENRLLAGEPVQYVTNIAHFFGLKFFVCKDVLIPRQETEILVDTIIKRSKDFTNLQILDIGTGSGCIAISLKKYIPQAQIWALDISEKALSVCIDNAKKNEVKVNTVLFDILGSAKFPANTKFDIIVSNPPYVLESEKALMHKNVTEFEPTIALYISDEDPLIYYNAIASFAENHINIDGELIVEINEKFPTQVMELHKDMGFLENEIISDLNNKPRFICSKK